MYECLDTHSPLHSLTLTLKLTLLLLLECAYSMAPHSPTPRAALAHTSPVYLTTSPAISLDPVLEGL